MGFLGIVNLFLLRVNLSVAIVAMVNSTRNEVANQSDICSERGSGPVSDIKTVPACVDCS